MQYSEWYNSAHSDWFASTFPTYKSVNLYPTLPYYIKDLNLRFTGFTQTGQQASVDAYLIPQDKTAVLIENLSELAFPDLPAEVSNYHIARFPLQSFNHPLQALQPESAFIMEAQANTSGQVNMPTGQWADNGTSGVITLVAPAGTGSVAMSPNIAALSYPNSPTYNGGFQFQARGTLQQRPLEGLLQSNVDNIHTVHLELDFVATEPFVLLLIANGQATAQFTYNLLVKCRHLDNPPVLESSQT